MAHNKGEQFLICKNKCAHCHCMLRVFSQDYIQNSTYHPIRASYARTCPNSNTIQCNPLLKNIDAGENSDIIISPDIYCLL